MKELMVEVKTRESLGKNSARRLRHQNMIPGIVYGDKNPPVAVVVDPKRILEILRSQSGENTIFQLGLAGTDTRRHVMIKDYQVDPVKGNLIHADFVRIQMDAVIEVDVPVHVTGESAGVKLDGGILEHVTREVRVSCLPGDIPEHIVIDVTALKIGDALRVSDLPTSARYKILADPEQTIVVIGAPAKEEVTPAPGEAVAAAAPAEPEVIKKGKAVGEGEEEAEGEEEGRKPKEARKPEGKQ